MPAELWRQAPDAVARFDAAALAYDTYRPGYPAGLFDDLADRCHLAAGDVVVEVGAGTGIASVDLAARGTTLVCLEPSPQMAALARAKLAAWGNATVVESTFEQWAPAVPNARLVCAANAWHWVDPAIGWSKAASLLAPDGHLALLWHDLVGYEPGDFGRRLAEVGGALNPALAAAPRDVGLDDQDTWTAKIQASGHFDVPTTSRYRFRRELGADAFVATLNTYGINAGLDLATRQRLDAALTDLIKTEFGGAVVKVEDAVLHTARRYPRR